MRWSNYLERKKTGNEDRPTHDHGAGVVRFEWTGWGREGAACQALMKSCKQWSLGLEVTRYLSLG